MYFEIFEIEITINADTEPRVCASPGNDNLRLLAPGRKKAEEIMKEKAH
jgi:hypothetical protein